MKRRTKIDRLREIAKILLKHGLIDFIEELGLASFISKKRLEESLEEKMKETKAEDIRGLFEDLGPTFVKLGQFLAMRPDLVPPQFANELKELHEEATPFSPEVAKKIIEKELGDNLCNIFEDFYNYPLGAASIGQVHEATLKNGKEVVVKVQRPDIRKMVQADMELIKKLAKLIERHIPESQMYHPEETIKEFQKMLEKEMDFTTEARSAQKFYDAFEDDADLNIPKVHWEYVTKKVIVLENVKGESITKAIHGDYPVELKKKLATEMARAMLKQFFIHGVFHADPSPGNIFFREDGTLTLLDFGAIGRLSDERRNKLIDMFIAMARNDTKKIMGVLLDIGDVHGKIDKNELEWDIEDVLDLYKKKMDTSFLEGANEEIMNIATKHNITLPPNFLLMERALIATEGVCSSLDPEFDFFEASKPVIKEIIKNRYGPKAQVEKLLGTAKSFHDLFSKLPDRLNNIMERIENEELSVAIEHKGLDDLEYTIELVSNRLSFTIILASIIIGSALLILGTDEIILGPYIFLVSVVIGVWLLAIIIKRGKY
ncbi:MAG: AarF/ABC1/UbiB kinase family protein [Candidatus Saliniplasma sp.]